MRPGVLVGIALDVVEDLSDYAPHNLVDAQFSLPYATALKLMGAPVGPRWHDPDRLNSPRVREVMGKVALEVDLDMQRLFDERHTVGAVVKIEGVDGSVETARVDFASGNPERPMSDAELEAKFRLLAKEAISDASAESAFRFVQELEGAGLVTELGSMLAG